MRTLLLALLTLSFLPAQAPTDWKLVRDRVEQLTRELDKRDRREATLRERVASLEAQIEEDRELREREQAESASRLASEAIESVLSEHLASGVDWQLNEQRRAAVEIGGYFDLEFRRDDASGNTEFDHHRLILQFGADILEDAITFRSEIEIEGGGADASFLSGNEIVVEFAEVHFHIDELFNVKVGALIMPFGQFNELHDSPLRDLTDRPLVNRYIIPTTWTDAGIGFYGAVDTSVAVFDYDVVLTNGLDDDFSSTPGGGFRGNRSSFRADNNDNKQVTGRIGVRPHLDFLDSALLGFSFGYGHYDDGADHSILMFAFDWRLRRGDFEFLGEYAFIDLERGADQIAGGAPGQADGYYVQVNWHLFPADWRGASLFANEESTFTAVLRFGSVDTDHGGRGVDRDTRGAAFRDDLKRLTVGLNYRPIEKTVLKVEYQFLIEDGVRGAANDRIVISLATYF